MRSILFLVGLIAPIAAFSQQGLDQKMKVVANIQGGCIVQGDDFIYPENILKNGEIFLEAFADLKIKCSKNTTISINQHGTVSSMESSATNNIMGLDGKSGQPPFSYIKYQVKTLPIPESTDFSVLNQSDVINASSGNITIKVNVPNQITIPLKTDMFDMHISAWLMAARGTYTDWIVYELTF